MDEHATALPANLELVWGRRTRPRRGPKPGLTLERIVAAAMEIADADGLAPLSMSRLAERLGFTTMSLYRYVTGKDELLTLMVDAAVGPPPAGDDPDWRTGMQRWARANLAAFHRHPWVVHMPITGPPLTPGQLAWFDWGLRILAPTGLAGWEKVAVVQLVSGYVRHEARLWHELRQAAAAATASEDGPPPSYGDLLRLVVDRERFPALYEVVVTGIFDGAVDYSDEDFDYGLQRLLDGVAVLVDQRR